MSLPCKQSFALGIFLLLALMHNALDQITIESPVGHLKGFSFSGLATYLQIPELDLCFDMGECPLSAIGLNHVFLTHAHGDHSRCLMRHESLRRMMGIDKNPVYYIPDFLYDAYLEVLKAEARFEHISPEKFRLPDLRKVSAKQTTALEFRKDLVFQAFPVKHSLPSYGYTIFHRKNKLNQEHLGKPPAELISMRNAGKSITHEVLAPLVTFLGDCQGTSLKNYGHILKSRVLVMEATFLEEDEIRMAHQKAHTHIRDIAEMLESAESVDCEMIVLSHFSLKYSRKQIENQVYTEIPEKWHSRIKLLL